MTAQNYRETGIWSAAAGGFIDGPFYTLTEAESALKAWAAEGEDDAEIIDWIDEDAEEDS
jgi:hypothetical protein